MVGFLRVGFGVAGSRVGRERGDAGGPRILEECMRGTVAATVAVGILVSASPSVAGGYDKQVLERDVRAIHATGVRARVNVGGEVRLEATSGVADVTTGRPVRAGSYF